MPRQQRMVLLVLGGLLTGVFVAIGGWAAAGGFGSANAVNEERVALDRTFRAPPPYELASVMKERPFRCAAGDATCVEEYLGRITDQHGPRAALEVLGVLQRQRRVDASVDDHDLAHVIGRQTAETFGATRRSFDLCTIAFNYGCQHGFFQYVLGKAGTAKEAASFICESAGRRGPDTVRFSCYHGVGHGVMMSYAYDLERSLDSCDALGEGTPAVGCWQGVFMENVNAAARDEARKGMFSPADPLSPCNKVADRYQHQCFINHAGWLMQVSKNSVRKATRTCLRAASHVSTCMQSIGLMVTNPVWQTNLSPDAGKRSFERVAWDLCTEFPAARRVDCVVAGVDNLGNFDRLRLDRSERFCGIVAAPLRQACWRQIGVNVSRQTTSTAEMRTACRSLSGPAARTCLATAGV